MRIYKFFKERNALNGQKYNTEILIEPEWYKALLTIEKVGNSIYLVFDKQKHEVISWDNEANDKLLIKTIRWDKTRIDFSEI